MSRLAYFTRETLISLRRNLLMTFAGIMTVAVSLFLFGGILLVSAHRRPRHQPVEARRRARDLHEGRTRAQQQIADVADELDAPIPNVKSYRFLNHDDAYDEFKKHLPDQPVLVESDDARRRCPTSFRVAPTKAELTAGGRQRVRERARRRRRSSPPQEQVEDACSTSTQWIRLRVLRAWPRVLLASSLFLIVNTIRLATFARRREIEVMKLVGASNWFVRVPFMAEGLVQGAIGAGLRVRARLRAEGRDQPNFVEDRRNLLRRFYVANARRVRHRLCSCCSSAPRIGMIGSLIGLRRFLEA